MPRLSLAYKTALFFSGSALAAYNARVLATSPIRYFPMVSDTSILDDISANDDDGTYTGATLQSTPGPFGGLAPLFDGINNDANFFSAALATAFNDEEGCALIWLNNDDFWDNGVQSRILFFYGDGSNLIELYKTSSNNLVYRHEGSNNNVAAAVAPGTPTGWVSLLLSWSVANDELKLYRNGLQIGSTLTGVTAWNTSLAFARIASNTATDYMNASAAHVSLFNTPADADIIALATP